MVLASLTSSVTTLIGDHGLYAVFVLMAVDAVFPAASELVMLYAGALAAGAFSGQHVHVNPAQRVKIPEPLMHVAGDDHRRRFAHTEALFFFLTRPRPPEPLRSSWRAARDIP